MEVHRGFIVICVADVAAIIRVCLVCEVAVIILHSAPPLRCIVWCGVVADAAVLGRIDQVCYCAVVRDVRCERVIEHLPVCICVVLVDAVVVAVQTTPMAHIGLECR